MNYVNNLDVPLKEGINGKFKYTLPKIDSYIHVITQDNYQNGTVPMKVCGHNSDGTVSVDCCGEERTVRVEKTSNGDCMIFRWIECTL